MKRVPNEEQTKKIEQRFKLIGGRLWYKNPSSNEFVLSSKESFSVNRYTITHKQITYYLTYGTWPTDPLRTMPWDDLGSRLNESWRGFAVNLEESDYQAIKESIRRSGKTMSVFVRSAIKEKIRRERNDTALPINPQSPANFTSG